MKLRVRATELFIHHLRARMPSRDGIATMARVPHLFLRLTLELDLSLFTPTAEWTFASPDA